MNRKIKGIVKKACAMFIVMSLLITNAPVLFAAQAATGAKLIVSSKYAKAGDLVDITLSLENNPGIVSMYLNINYDNSRLALKKVTDGGLLQDKSFGNNLGANPYKVNWDGSLLEENITNNGLLVTLQFEVLANAPTGNALISVTHGNNGILNYDLSPVPFEIVNGGVNVINEETSSVITVGDSQIIVDTSSDMVTAMVPNDGVVNFPSRAPKKEGKLFTGWYSSSKNPVINGSALLTGDTLTAGFINFVTSGTNANFAVDGVQIRTEGVQGLRFINKMAKSTLRDALSAIDSGFIPDQSADTEIGYGMVVFPTEYVPEGGLFKETSRTVGTHTDYAVIVPAVKDFTNLHPSPVDDFIYYTVVLTGITDYNKNYTVRPYITYKDASGLAHTVYGDSYSTNVYDIAIAAYHSPTESAATKAYLLKNIFGNVEP